MILNMLRLIALLVISVAALCASDVSGKWNVTAVAPGGREYKMDLSLKQEGGKWTGMMSSERGSVPLEDVQVAGNNVIYKLAVGESAYLIKLTVADGALKGTFTGPDGTSGEVKAVRAVEVGSGSASSVIGRWKMVATSSSRPEGRNLVLDLKNDGGKLTGSIGPEGGDSAAITDAALSGSELTFKVSTGDANYELKMTSSGDSLKGSFKSSEGGTGTITGKR
jgi:hypothetical protein